MSTSGSGKRQFSKVYEKFSENGKKIDGQMHDHFKYRKNKVEYTIGEDKYLYDAKIRRLAKTCSCLLSRRLMNDLSYHFPNFELNNPRHIQIRTNLKIWRAFSDATFSFLSKLNRNS